MSSVFDIVVTVVVIAAAWFIVRWSMARKGLIRA